jgi:hypothetical protein
MQPQEEYKAPGLPWHVNMALVAVAMLGAYIGWRIWG